jgi:hypothetical protein
MHRDDLQREVEEIKQDAKVQQALKQASLTKKIKGPVARARDKFVIGTHVVLLVALAVIYKLLEFWSQRLNERYPELSQYYPLALKLVVAIAALVVSLIILRLLDLYFLNRIADAVYQYNLKRVSRLVIWLVIGFLVLTIFFHSPDLEPFGGGQLYFICGGPPCASKEERFLDRDFASFNSWRCSQFFCFVCGDQHHGRLWCRSKDKDFEQQCQYPYRVS